MSLKTLTFLETAAMFYFTACATEVFDKPHFYAL